MWEALARLGGPATECASAPVWPLSDQDLVTALDEVHRLEQVLAATKLHLIREAETRGLPAAAHCTSTAVWLRQRLHICAPTGHRLAQLARELHQHPAVDAALSAGEVNTEQAQVITTHLGQLPEELDAELTDVVEKIMIGWAGRDGFDPKALRQMAPRLLHHVAPELADRADEEALRRQERHAEKTKAFNLSNTGDGRYRVTGWLPAEAAAIVTAALDPLCKPLPEDNRTPTQRRADALVEVCKLTLTTTHPPERGGQHTQLAVTAPFDLLRGALGVGQLDSGDRLSADQVRRLACDARILPVVLGGTGQVLDAGRSCRLFTGPLRRAIIIRDGGCAFPGCDRPPGWCEAHHIVPWTDGGPTSLDNGVMLCGYHHRLIHHDDWTVRIAADGLPEFIPPHHVDPERRPRRNIYHRRN